MEEMHSAAITSGDPVKMFESSNQLLVNKSAMKYTTASAMLRCGAALAAAKQDAAGSALHLAHVQQAEHTNRPPPKGDRSEGLCINMSNLVDFS